MGNLFFGFFKPSDEDIKIFSEIHDFIEKHPSTKVVGRGTIIVEPSEITSTDSFQDDLELAHQLKNIANV